MGQQPYIKNKRLVKGHLGETGIEAVHAEGRARPSANVVFTNPESYLISFPFTVCDSLMQESVRGKRDPSSK